MTRTMITLVSAVALVLASSVTTAAQGKRGSTPKPQHVSAKGTKVSSPKNTQAGPKVKGAVATKAPRVDAGRGAKVAKADTKAPKTDRKNTTTTTAPTASGTETPITLTRVQEKLQKNTSLADRLEGRLPRGTTLMDAAEGFRNLGQFVAAVNVSNNLGLDFERLKIAMVDDGKSLGQAIQFVKTDVDNPTLVAQRAEAQAQALIQQTETATTTTAKTQTKSKAAPKRTRAGSGS